MVHLAEEITTQPRFLKAIQANGIEFCSMCAAVTPTPRFNALVEKWDSKGTVLADGLISLLAAINEPCPDDTPVHFVVDKHGGRNFYAAMIQTAFPNGWVTPLVESAEESTYRIDGLNRPVTLVFALGRIAMPCRSRWRPCSRNLREVFMRQFNKFWQQHVPDLEPTAGYPNDSRRFYGLIQRAMRQLGIHENQVWRNADLYAFSTFECSSSVTLESSLFGLVKCTTGTTMSSSRTRSVARPVAR